LAFPLLIKKKIKTPMMIHQFKAKLELAFPDIPVEYVDESYSSIEAEDLMRETGIGRRKKNRAQDSEAAKLVLIRYLQRFS
jgi:RNase H-fold protein (predicted Holliday junction resolvase)